MAKKFVVANGTQDSLAAHLIEVILLYPSDLQMKRLLDILREASADDYDQIICSGSIIEACLAVFEHARDNGCHHLLRCAVDRRRPLEQAAPNKRRKQSVSAVCKRAL